MHFFFLRQYHFINKFDPNYLNKLDKNISIIYRNYNQKNNIFIIKKIKKFCNVNNREFLLANDIKLAIKLNLNGVYLPSFNKSMTHNCYSLRKNFKVIGSAHNIFELNLKKKQKITEIFLSPVFKKIGKKTLGIYGFIKLSNVSNLVNIALGGVNKNNIKHL